MGRKGEIGRGYLAVGPDAIALAHILLCGSQHRSHALPSPGCAHLYPQVTSTSKLLLPLVTLHSMSSVA